MGKKGFTLLEVLVSIAILAIIMILVQATTSQIFNAKERVEKRDALWQAGRVAMGKLSDDLQLSFLIKTVPASQ